MCMHSCGVVGIHMNCDSQTMCRCSSAAGGHTTRNSDHSPPLDAPVMHPPPLPDAQITLLSVTHSPLLPTVPVPLSLLPLVRFLIIRNHKAASSSIKKQFGECGSPGVNPTRCVDARRGKRDGPNQMGALSSAAKPGAGAGDWCGRPPPPPVPAGCPL